VNESAIEVLDAKSTELVHLQAQAASKALAVAQQIGYEGTVAVGALEDEIRFYQRRSVESLLEAGKRLVVLRELCQFGTEFDQRVELLGFSRRTAYRFMQAAAKVATGSQANKRRQLDAASYKTGVPQFLDRCSSCKHGGKPSLGNHTRHDLVCTLFHCGVKTHGCCSRFDAKEDGHALRS
jgi:hypothetical protein